MKYDVTVLALAAALVLALTGCAAKETPSETAPQPPAPADSIGAVIVDPIADGAQYQVPDGTDTISLYTEREGAEPGDGVFTLYDDADDSVIAKIPAASDRVTFAPLSEEAKAYYGMDRGTEIHISLEEPLQAKNRYYAALSEGFVRYGEVSSKELGGKESWPIQMEE